MLRKLRARKEGLGRPPAHVSTKVRERNVKSVYRIRVVLFVAAALAVMAVVPAVASAATFSLAYNFDTTIDDAMSAPYVGTGTLTYQNATRLPSGLYSLKTLRDTYGATFTAAITGASLGGTQTWTLADLVSPIENVNVYIIGESFVFTSPEANSGGPRHGSADFINGAGYHFSEEPLFDDCLSFTRGTSITYAMYFVDTGVSTPMIYFGNYGGSVGAVLSNADLDAGLSSEPTPTTPTTPAASVPASSGWSIAALLVVGLAVPLAGRSRRQLR